MWQREVHSDNTILYASDEQSNIEVCVLTHLQDAGVQWAAAAAPAVPAHLAGTLQRQPSAVAAMPAAQMRKAREALSDDASLIAANRAKAEAIAECLASGF